MHIHWLDLWPQHRCTNTWIHAYICTYTNTQNKTKRNKRTSQLKRKKMRARHRDAYKPSTLDMQTGRSGVQTHFPLQSEFGASLCYIRLCFPHPQNKSQGRWLSTYYETNSVHEELSLIRLASCWWHRLVIPTSKNQQNKTTKTNSDQFKKKRKKKQWKFLRKFSNNYFPKC